MRRKYAFKVDLDYQGYTLEEFLKLSLPQFAETTIRKMIHEGNVTVGNQKDTTRKLITGDEVYVLLPKDSERTYPEKGLDIEVLYENNDLLVVNKPAGVTVIPERWSREHIFKESIVSYLKKKNDKGTPRIVHRIDKEASGVLVVAKNRELEKYLSKLFEKRNITKKYKAIVSGVPPESGRIELPIKQASKKSSRMVVDEFGKKSITNYKVIQAFRDFALLELHIETGRTHQIRVHMAAQGYPLAVDSIYGYRQALNLSALKTNYQAKKKKPEKPIISRLTLHASEISFQMPEEEETITVEAPFPKDFQIALKMLAKYRA